MKHLVQEVKREGSKTATLEAEKLQLVVDTEPQQDFVENETLQGSVAFEMRLNSDESEQIWKYFH